LILHGSQLLSLQIKKKAIWKAKTTEQSKSSLSFINHIWLNSQGSNKSSINLNVFH
jgi:hypothetical protein